MTLGLKIDWFYAECHDAECHYAECRVFLIVMLRVIMLSVIILSVFMLNFIMLSVGAPHIILAPAPSTAILTYSAILHFFR